MSETTKRQTVFYGVLKIHLWLIIVSPTWWRWKEEGREGSGRPMAVPWPGPASTEFPHSIHTLHSWSSTFVSTIYPSYMHNCSYPPTFIGIHHLFTISTTLHWVTITNTHQHFCSKISPQNSHHGYREGIFMQRVTNRIASGSLDLGDDLLASQPGATPSSNASMCATRQFLPPCPPCKDICHSSKSLLLNNEERRTNFIEPD